MFDWSWLQCSEREDRLLYLPCDESDSAQPRPVGEEKARGEPSVLNSFFLKEEGEEGE